MPPGSACCYHCVVLKRDLKTVIILLLADALAAAVVVNVLIRTVF